MTNTSPSTDSSATVFSLSGCSGFCEPHAQTSWPEMPFNEALLVLKKCPAFHEEAAAHQAVLRIEGVGDCHLPKELIAIDWLDSLEIIASSHPYTGKMMVGRVPDAPIAFLDRNACEFTLEDATTLRIIGVAPNEEEFNFDALDLAHDDRLCLVRDVRY